MPSLIARAQHRNANDLLLQDDYLNAGGRATQQAKAELALQPLTTLRPRLALSLQLNFGQHFLHIVDVLIG